MEVPTFDNIDSQYFDPESKKRYRTKLSCYPYMYCGSVLCMISILGSMILLYNGDDDILLYRPVEPLTTSGCELSGLFIIYCNAYKSEDKSLQAYN